MTPLQQEAWNILVDISRKPWTNGATLSQKRQDAIVAADDELKRLREKLVSLTGKEQP